MATATALISPYLTPSTTAIPRATRSAHVPTGYDAFSILAPVNVRPSLRTMQQPTLKFEYGPIVRQFAHHRKQIPEYKQYAFSLASRACLLINLICWPSNSNSYGSTLLFSSCPSAASGILKVRMKSLSCYQQTLDACSGQDLDNQPHITATRSFRRWEIPPRTSPTSEVLFHSTTLNLSSSSPLPTYPKCCSSGTLASSPQYLLFNHL